MIIHRIVTGVCLALGAGCTLPFSSTGADAGTAVEAGPDGVVIRNDGARHAFYMVMDADFAAVANWAACVDPGCRAVLSARNRRRAGRQASLIV
jgi:hypothetical protein